MLTKAKLILISVVLALLGRACTDVGEAVNAYRIAVSNNSSRS